MTYFASDRHSGHFNIIRLLRRPRMLNAGVDVNGFETVTFDELVVNDRKFNAAHADEAKENPFHSIARNGKGRIPRLPKLWQFAINCIFNLPKIGNGRGLETQGVIW